MLTTAFLNQKGGVGKSTLTINTASYLARLNNKVLVIDLDQQTDTSRILLKPDDFEKIIQTKQGSLQSSYATLVNNKPLPVIKGRIPNLDIVPSHIYLSSVDKKLIDVISRETRLQHHLASLRDKYDFCFIDCHRSLNFVTYNAILASDQIIIVISPGLFDLLNIQQVFSTVKLLKKSFTHKVKIKGILLNKINAYTVTHRTRNELKDSYSELLLKTEIPQNEAIGKAHYNFQDIFEHNPNCRAAQAIRDFIHKTILDQ